MIATLFGAIAALAVANPLQAHGLIDEYLVARPAEEVRAPMPIKRRKDVIGIRTSAPSAFVADLATGKVLFSKDANRVMPIASISKLVTAMTWLDQKPDLDKTITFLEADFAVDPKSPFKAGDVLTKRDVLQAMLVGSINSAAYALARTSTSGTEAFIEAMNHKTDALGLWTPVFYEPSGYDPRNQSSAADVAAIIATASGYPEIRDAASHADITLITKDAEKREVKIKSTNLLLSSFLNKKPFTIVAAKTGTLPEAGNCMAQVTRNADGHQIIAVELGGGTHLGRFQDIKALTAWSFDTYEWK